MPFKSEAQRKYVMAKIGKDLPRRLAKVAGVSSRETRGLQHFKYSAKPFSTHVAWMLGEGDKPGGKRVVFWEEERGAGSGDYSGHYNKGTKAIWVQRTEDLVDRHHPSTRNAVARAAKSTLKHEIGHHVWEKLPQQTRAKLMRDDDFRGSVTKIMRTEGKHYLDFADTEAFARLYQHTRGARLSAKRKKIPYNQHSRKLMAHVLRTLRNYRRD
jgi:hypothetical protein